MSQQDDEAIAAMRFNIMNITRIGGVVLVGAGLAVVREVIAAPYALGVALAIAGVGGFFFAPSLLAKRWKAADREADRAGDQDAQ